MIERPGVTDRGKQIAAELSEKNVTFMATGIAYNAFLSLVPILVILLAVISTVGGGLEARVVELSQESLPGPIADVVAEVFEGGAGDPAASVVGLVVLIWGTLKIFRELDTAFSEIYETTEKGTFPEKLVDGLIVFVALVVAVVATVGVTAVFERFANAIPYIGLLTPLVLIGGLVVAFLPMYYRFPDTAVEWRYTLPDAAFAAVGWAGFQVLFQVYLAFAGGSSDSLFGGVAVVITWLYFSGLVLLVGAVINAVLGGHTSGGPGGIGRGATTTETRREEELNRDEVAAALRDLREALTDEETESVTDADIDTADRYPEPNGDVTVIERSKPDDDARELSVAFRWRTNSDDLDERSEITDE